MECIVDVENTPKQCEKYIVARYSCLDDGLWFWGSFDNYSEAKKVASDVEGVVCVRGEESK